MKIDILKCFSNFSGKHLRQGLFFNKNDSSTGVSANFEKFLRTLFTDQFRTTASDYTFIERKTTIFRTKTLRVSALEIMALIKKSRLFTSFSLNIEKIV